MFRKLPALCLVAIASACSASRSDLADSYGGEDVLVAVETATSLDGYRLDPDAQPKDFDAPLADYVVRLGPTPASNEQREALAALLTHVDSFMLDPDGPVKACIPRYGVRLEFSGEAGPPVDLLICFECELMLVHRKGRYQGSLSFDPIAGVLRSAVDTFLPDE